jgi:hypothetical protein
VIESVSAADINTGEPLSAQEHFSVSDGNQTIRLDVSDAFAFRLKVTTKGARATATVVSGNGWLKVRELTNESDQEQLFLIVLSGNGEASGRVGVVALVNDKFPQERRVVSIYQRGSSTSGDTDEYAPVIVSVVAINPMNDQPLVNPKHITSSPFTSIKVGTHDTYALLFEVLGMPSPAAGRVHFGDWLSLSEQSTGMSGSTTRMFRLHIQQNGTPNSRAGSIEFYNTKAPAQKIIIEIRQDGKKELHEPENIRDRLALNYVAEWNVDRKLAFITTHDNKENQKALFSFVDATTLFAQPVTVEGRNYILPSCMQWLSIVPIEGVYSRSDKLELNLSETCMVGGRTIESKNHYLNVKSTHTTYAIRFIGDKEQQSVWRYVYKDNPSGSGKILTIEERHMTPEASWTLESISNDTFWEQDRDQVVIRCFSTPGYALGNPYTGQPDNNRIEYFGECGFYWSSTSAGVEQAWAMEVLDPQVRTRDFYAKIDGNSIRPFRQTLME